MRVLIAFLACLIFAGCGEPPPEEEATVIPIEESGGCGAPSSTASDSDLSWVSARTPIYRLTSEGEFAVGGFDGRPWKVLNSHLPANMGPQLAMSPDGRWIAFETGSAEPGRQDHWLFDVSTQTERRIATVRLYHVGELEFSPSSKALAYYVSHDSRYTEDGDLGLHLIDVQSGAARQAGFPRSSRLAAQQGYGSIVWSADGSSILLHWVGHDASGFVREFHRLDVRTMKFHQIDGVYDQRKTGERFVEGGRDIAQHQNDPSKMMRWFGELDAPSRRFKARIDDQLRLVVRDEAGQERILDRGTYNHCEGETIGLTDWVDGDRYLVYRVSGDQYIADPRTGRRAKLFDSSPMDTSYVW
jgi:hypothetical protein